MTYQFTDNTITLFFTVVLNGIAQISNAIVELKGFNALVKGQSKMPSTGELFKSVSPEDLVKFGLIPEFVGRLPVIATLGELDEAALIQILTEPKNSLIKQYAKLFEMEGVTLEFRDDALRAVAVKAMERKTGARGLRSILESVLLDTMYEIPSLEGVSKVVIDGSVIAGESEPLLIYSQQEEARVDGTDG